MIVYLSLFLPFQSYYCIVEVLNGVLQWNILVDFVSKFLVCSLLFHHLLYKIFYFNLARGPQWCSPGTAILHQRCYLALAGESVSLSMHWVVHQYLQWMNLSFMCIGCVLTDTWNTLKRRHFGCISFAVLPLHFSTFLFCSFALNWPDPLVALFL